jgi:molybdenum cofactor cytidylyltransferase
LKIAAIVLAAGQSRRMGFNKLLADVGGKPLILRTVENIEASRVEDVMVVTGFQADDLEAALRGARVRFVRNADYALGLASSLRVGVDAIQDFDAVLVCLGDMPLVSTAIINRMIDALLQEPGRGLVLPVRDGEIGNPVLWGQKYFPELLALQGDRGARGLIEKYRAEAIAVESDSDGVALDADTPQSLARIKSIAGF